MKKNLRKLGVYALVIIALSSCKKDSIEDIYVARSLWFLAREVFVGTMSTIYSVGDDDIRSIQKRLADVKRQDGEKFFTPAVGISLIFKLSMCLILT